MKGRRYSEGGDEIPELTFEVQTENNATDNLRTRRRTKYFVPDKAFTSGTSDARLCFVERDFSEKLQQFMLSYSYTLVTTKVLSGEV